MNRPQTVQPPRTIPPWRRHLALTVALLAALVSVYGGGSLLEAVVTLAVVS